MILFTCGLAESYFCLGYFCCYLIFIVDEGVKKIIFGDPKLFLRVMLCLQNFHNKTYIIRRY